MTSLIFMAYAMGSFRPTIPAGTLNLSWESVFWVVVMLVIGVWFLAKLFEEMR